MSSNISSEENTIKCKSLTTRASSSHSAALATSYKISGVRNRRNVGCMSSVYI